MQWRKIITIKTPISDASHAIADLTTKVYNIQAILEMGLDRYPIMYWIKQIVLNRNCNSTNPIIVGNYKFACETVDNNINITFFKKVTNSNNTQSYVASYVAYMTTEEMANLAFDNSIKDKKAAACCIQKWLSEHLVFPKGIHLSDKQLDDLFDNKEVWLIDDSFLIMDPMTESVHYYIRKYKVEPTKSCK
jgi:hypothetical protein